MNGDVPDFGDSGHLTMVNAAIRKIDMKSYKAIEAEIEKLKKQAATVRKAELKSVISAIRKQIAQYGLTAEELGFGAVANAAGGKAARRAPAVPSPTIGVPKYRDPVSQKTWTGRGKPPLWIVGVKNRDDFLIDRSAAAPKVVVPADKPQASASTRAAAGKKTRAASPKSASAKPAAAKKRTPRKTSAVKAAPEAA